MVAALAQAGHRVLLLSRIRAKGAGLLSQGDVRILTTLDELDAATRIDAIVNLAGEPISDGLWTRAKRFRIVRSRLDMTYGVLRLIDRLDHKPGALVNGSAVGWYGLRGDEPLSEADGGTPCFSRRVCTAWEGAAVKAERRGVRTILLRIGLVLDNDGGMLARMLTPFEFGLGGRFGVGTHWMSWIHRDDLVRLIIHTIASPTLAGPLNATAPQPVTNAQFTRALGRALRRPAILPVPAAPLRLVGGQFTQELLLSGQRILPTAALQSGFVFAYPDVQCALNAITGSKSQST